MASTEVDMWDDWEYYWARLNPGKTSEEMPKENPWKDDPEGFRRAVAIVEADMAPSGRIERSIWGVLVPSYEGDTDDWDVIAPPNELGIDWLDTDPSQHPREGSDFINPRLDAEHWRWGGRQWERVLKPEEEPLSPDPDEGRSGDDYGRGRFSGYPSMAGIGGSLSGGPGYSASATPEKKDWSAIQEALNKLEIPQESGQFGGAGPKVGRTTDIELAKYGVTPKVGSIMDLGFLNPETLRRRKRFA